MSLCPGCFKEKGKAPKCDFCDYDESLKRSTIVLPHLTHLNHDHYIVGRLLGKPGGFGLTYLGWDLRLNKRVAIKEYLPRTLSSRDPDRCTVNSHSKDDAESFSYGLKRFLEEARTLAQIDHPNVVRVRDFFEENGTAYLVMDYYEGVTLAEYLESVKGRTLPGKQALAIIMPILDGLKEVHEKGFLHRDIKPHNIYLTSKNKPILLDFGAARQAMGEKSSSMSVVLSEGYAPLEQYQRNGKQGPWTDVYGAAATLFTILEGRVYPSPLDQINDPDWMVEEPAPLQSDILSLMIINRLGKGLALNASERIQSISEFQESLLSASDIVDKDSDLSESAAKPTLLAKKSLNKVQERLRAVGLTGSAYLKKVGVETLYGSTAIYYTTIIAGFLLGVMRPPAEFTMHLDKDMVVIAFWGLTLFLSPIVNTVIKSKEIALLSVCVSVAINIILPVLYVSRESPIQLRIEDFLSISIGFIATYALYMTKNYLGELSDE